MSGAALDTAIDLVFRAPGNAIDISRNRITFNSIDGTGILFEDIQGPSTVNFDGNRILMFDDFFLPNERGIFFQAATGNTTLSSTQSQNNIIQNQNGTTFPTTVPVTTAPGVTGNLLINGQNTAF